MASLPKDEMFSFSDQVIRDKIDCNNNDKNK